MHLSSLYNSNESGRIILSSTLDLKLKSMTAHRLCAREDTFFIIIIIIIIIVVVVVVVVVLSYSSRSSADCWRRNCFADKMLLLQRLICTYLLHYLYNSSKVINMHKALHSQLPQYLAEDCQLQTDIGRRSFTAIGWCLDVCHKNNTNASRGQEFFRRWTLSLELSACRIKWQRYLTCTV